MRTYLRLLSVQLNQRYGVSALKASFREQPGKTIGKTLLWLFVIISFGVLIGMYAWLVSVLLPAFTALDMGHILLGVVLLVSMVMTFFLGMVYLIGVLFFAKDTEFLASLPISQRTVFSVKFSQVLISEMGVSLLLLLPPFIIYGVQVGVGIGYWLRMLLVTLLAPCIPLALSALLSLVLMRFTALWRHRDLLTVIGSILLIVLIFAGQGILQAYMPQEMTQDAVIALISDGSGLLRQVVSAFPPSGWAAEGMLGNMGMLLLFAGVSALALLLVTLISGRIYYRGAMAQLETASSSKRVKITGKTTRRQGLMRALFVREWKTVLRSPVYALNGLIMIIVGPLMMFFPVLFQGTANSGEMDMFFAMIDGAVDARLMLLVVSAVFLFIAFVSPATFTSVSREGKMFGFLRTIPVSPARQVIVKYLFGQSIGMLGMVLMAVCGAAVLGFSPRLMLAAVGLSILASVAPMALAMLPDVIKPKLSWNSETEAIKQNANAIIGMLITWVYIGLLGFGCYWLIRSGVSLSVVIGALMGVSVALGAVCIYVLCAVSRRSWRKIEG